MWHVTRDALFDFGFPMREIDRAGEPANIAATGLHINPLEFIAVIIVNLWLALKLIATCPALATGYIVNLLSDNTSAIAWIKVAGKAQDPGTRRLARLASALIIHACALTTLFQTNHIPGVENDEADCLSRLVRGSVPSWDFVTDLWPRLATCRICLLPPELLSTLASTLLSPLIEGTYEQTTTRLLTLELVILPDGLRPPTLQSTLSPT
jgi:hypothetical protein